MKAVISEQFAGIDQIKLANIPKPEPLPNEVQIQVAYAAVNPVDWKIVEGHLKDRLPHEFPIVLGWDVSGTISKVGRDVTDLLVGDEVFAYARKPTVKWGTYAEYVCFEGKDVVRKPANLTLEQAAAIPLTGLTAWQSLVEAAKLKRGEAVLIHAGAGGVGSMAIQFAKHLGAKVITTASTENHDYVKKLGADIAIDYHKESFVEKIKEIFPNGIDVVFDTIGGKTQQESFNVLKKRGRIVSIVQPISETEAMKHDCIAHYVFVRPNGAHLKTIAELLESKAIMPPAIEIFPLEQAKEALEKSKEGHTLGKIVLKVRDGKS